MPKLQLNSIEHYYEVTGKGEPLLLIHGLGSSTQDWEFQVSHFSTNYKVVSYDVRGHGQTDKPTDPYSIPMFAEDAIELVKALKLDTVHVAGISMGGAIAYQMAVDVPALVKSLTVINFTPELLIETFADKKNLWTRQLIVRLLGMRKMGEVLGERLFPKTEHADIREQFADRWANNDKRAYLNAMNALVNWSVADRLDEIQCPVLVIASDEDYSPVSDKEVYMDRMKKAELVVIQDARHAVTAEKPDEFNKVLEKFLKQHN